MKVAGSGPTKDDPQRPPALVLGRGLTALGVVRSLARAGVPSYCVCQDLGLVGSSRWCRRTTPRITEPAQLPEFLERLPFESAVLLGCSDAWVRAIAALGPELARRYPSSSPSAATVSTLVDKRTLGETLLRLGLPHPRTETVRSAADLARVDDDRMARSFLKPTDSHTCSRRHHVKAFDVSSRREAQDLLSAVAVDGLEFVLQEYIPGSPDRHYLIDGFVDRTGRLRAAFARRRLRMHPAPYGNSSYFVSIASTEVGPGIDTLVTLFDDVAYRGIFSAEFKLDELDGRLKLLEVNVRPWWFVEFATRCGVNVCAMAYRDALGEDVEDVARYEVGARCVNLSTDVPAALSLMRQGRLSPISALRSWVGARESVFRIVDPLPAVRAVTRWVAGRVAGGARGSA